MTIDKSDITNHETIVVEYGTMLDFGSKTLELTDITDESPSYVDEPLEVTGYNGERKFRLYLDVNKVELVNDENGDFVGAIGSILDIFEPLDE